MKQNLAIILLVLFTVSTYATDVLPNAWINEIHYDNTGADVGEAVEIVVEEADQFNLALLTLELYNGGSGGVYKTFTLKDSLPCGRVEGFSFFLLNIPGIQNGAPDGFALSYEDHLLQFISYEGECEATDGVAYGTTSTDIGVVESGSVEIGQSLQLAGTGTKYSDFTWQERAASTYCGLNNDQSFDMATQMDEQILKPQIWVDVNRGVTILVAKDQTMKIYDISGREIYSSLLRKGRNHIPLNLNGVYIIKTDECVQKVMLR